METKEIINVENLFKYYPNQDGFFKRTVALTKAIDGINLKVYPGQTLGIVGESGSGKSTLANILIGLEKPTSGKVNLLNHEVSTYSKKQWKPLRKDIQMVFQNPYASLNPKKRVYDILKDAMLTHHVVTKDQLQNRMEELMDLVALPQQSLNKYPSQFSGGQRQRIAIAKALSVNPKILICDEPTSALDVSIQAQILDLLKSLQNQLNLTIIFIGHGLDAVRAISDQIAVMYQGKIVEYGSSEFIFDHPLHPYTINLLNSYPSIDPSIAKQFKVSIYSSSNSHKVVDKKSIQELLSLMKNQSLKANHLTKVNAQHYVLLERNEQ